MFAGHTATGTDVPVCWDSRIQTFRRLVVLGYSPAVTSTVVSHTVQGLPLPDGPVAAPGRTGTMTNMAPSDVPGTDTACQHTHGNRSHTHAHADIPHGHMLRAICQRPECESYPTHDIHPGPAAPGSAKQ